MKKQPIKIIKRSDGPSEPSPKKPEKPAKRKPSIESTVQAWITERRDNEETEDRSSYSRLAAWNADSLPKAA